MRFQANSQDPEDDGDRTQQVCPAKAGAPTMSRMPPGLSGPPQPLRRPTEPPGGAGAGRGRGRGREADGADLADVFSRSMQGVGGEPDGDEDVPYSLGRGRGMGRGRGARK